MKKLAKEMIVVAEALAFMGQATGLVYALLLLIG